MADVVIFGTGDYAEQATYYLQNDSPHRIVAYSLTGDRIKEPTFLGRPVVAFETVEREFAPDSNGFFLPMSSRRMNRDREHFFHAAKQKGYGLISYVSSSCVNHAAQVGENCFILERSNIQPFARIGNNCVIWCGTHVGHHSVIGDNSFLSGNVGISGRCRIGRNCHVSAAGVVNAGVNLAEGTLLGLSSVAVRDTEPWSVNTGNPARKRRPMSMNVDFL